MNKSEPPTPPPAPAPGSDPKATPSTSTPGSKSSTPAPEKKETKSDIPVGKLLIAAGVVLLILAAVLIPRFIHNHNVKTATEEMAISTVTVLHPKQGDAVVNLTLPGTVEAFSDSPIYARTNGYLKRWLVDIGAHVKQGQLLAEIETPEVDQELNQAIAARDQAKASYELAKTTSARWVDLQKQNAVAQQETDEKTGDFAVQGANLAAAQANVDRLQALKSYEKIVAPFDGIVTARSTDVGNLINSGSGSSAGQELFRVAQINTLRIYINVPEIDSAGMKVGTPVDITLASAPGVTVPGKIATTAGSIDPVSRTLLTEIEVPNPEEKLMPGGYAQVQFKVPLAKPPLIVPVNTLLFRANGPKIGVVTGGDTVSLRPVKIGRDFGTTVEIAEGLNADDSVILNPSDSLSDGLKVRVKEQPADPAKK